MEKAAPQLPAMDLATLQRYMVQWRQPPYRARQIVQWRNRGVLDPERMHNLPAPLRKRLQEEIECQPLRLVDRQVSTDGTRKYLFALADGGRVESVFIPEPHRGTVCLSTQVGCVFDCPFCRTGSQKFERNLSAGEILAQVFAIKEDLQRHPLQGLGAAVVTHVVYMGMGEPLANEKGLHASLAILLGKDGLALSKRRITVSTSGLVPAIDRLASAFPVNLAVSLHAADDALRNRLVPINRKYPLEALRACLDRYPLQPQRRITLEYAMLAGVNDSPSDADALSRFVHPGREKVNLILFNPFPGVSFKPTPPDKVDAFAQNLIRRGIRATVRRSRGADILAACGQLNSAREATS